MKRRYFAWKRTLLTVTFPLWIAPAIVAVLILGLAACAVGVYRGILDWVYPETEEYKQWLRNKRFEERRKRMMEEEHYE